ncbi:Gfo/Idh/MocA family protein [Rhizobium mesoamericanum]|uniref:Gfo/Idh/MocA family protein n=1 Tax=Rhizobium mesoamericanum TaxID=1079800 RepID=UPI00048BC3D2|nr:Gfo/Idh/MocA family oxidoreductase [Rhizobium mesoamericanum]
MPELSQGRINIAVVGAGLIGRRHIEGVLLEPRAALAAIIDPSESARDWALARGLPWFATLSEVLAERRPDGVIIATPNQLHVANALEAIASGLPVLIEKPIADDVDEAAKLVSAAENAGVPVLVGHHRRYNPLILETKRLLESGRLGTVLTAHGSFWAAKPDDYFNADWRRQPGAGPTLINLIHDVDLFRFLFGEVKSVHAMESNAARHLAVEDTAVVVLRFGAGTLATLTASDAVPSPWSWEMTSGENPVFPKQDQFCYQIGGTAGSLAVPELTLWTALGQPDWLRPLKAECLQITPADPQVLQLVHFCDVIEGRARPIVSGREGLATLRVIDAIKQSARTGQTIALERSRP